MRYVKFRINNYRAITGSMEINLGRDSLIPIIGVNESGKTTILHALFAFDFYNDHLNDNGRHIRDIHNLYQTSERSATISADIELTQDDFLKALDAVSKRAFKPPIEMAALAKTIRRYRRYRGKFPSTLTISRNLTSKAYSFVGIEVFDDIVLNRILSREILRRLPYLLFFDDFRDSVDERIEITKDEDGEVSSWLSIIEQLFKQTDQDFSVFN